eukprot:CAMPEP_0197644274 /NCGR_PEP_ID=MMETSP1338-20131121/17307_1 /TAXON_ID=43686 ORGANISM="Pelagodinium beii, Strain RCC1491" /NCGR_SAMPLE_ID=MMETSP1338 /ASSEMBLY_ACC=CAM_ASM_000754 /LENGTH=226 /DNA_ID=CAMNT_0043217645 /DNA_START=24 /DNA_END=701 /DNA_ORIENTATION=-
MALMLCFGLSKGSDASLGERLGDGIDFGRPWRWDRLWGGLGDGIDFGVAWETESFTAKGDLDARFLLSDEAPNSGIEDLAFCTWNHASQVCTAETERILQSVDTTVAAPLLPDIQDMLDCASYGQNLTLCSGNKYCEEDLNATCRTSSGPVTLQLVYSALPDILQMCGWLGAFASGAGCPSHEQDECAQAGCAVGKGFISNASGSCVEGSTCDDSLLTYAIRLCGD